MAQASDSEGILIMILFLVLSLLFFIFKQLKSQSPPLPPGPTSWPILGTINHLLKPMNHVALANLAQSYGPLMHLRLGTQHLFVGSSPAAAVEILKSNDRVLSARAVPHSVPLTVSEINKMSFWADTISDHWKNIRTICRTELFSTKGLESQAKLREEKVVEMVEKLRSKEGVVTNVQQMVFATVVNMFSNVFFSKDVIGLEEEFAYNQVKGFVRGIIGALSSPNLSDLYPFLGKLDPQGLRKKHREFSMRMWELWEPIVKERRDSDKGDLSKHDFLDNLFSRGFADDQINKCFEV